MGWILSASRASARIIERNGSQFSLVEEIHFEQGRLRDRDIDADRQGRTFESASAGRHALEPAQSPHEHAASVFAAQLAEKLRKGRLDNRYSRLVLVAEPHFLGVLRAALDPVTARLVVETLSKDLEPIPFQELGPHLLNSGSVHP